MPNSTRSWYDFVVSGEERATGGIPFTPYISNGEKSTSTSYSQNHRKLSGGRWSGGGPWTLVRDYTIYTGQKKYAWGSPPGKLGTGTVALASLLANVPGLSPYTVPSEATLLAMGATAIARTEPTSPAFDLSVFLGELRAEGLPNMPGSSVMERTKYAKQAGSEYLNVEFGWLPLVRGIRDFASTVNQADKITRSYRKHANVVTRRAYEWPSQSASSYGVSNFSSRPGGMFTFTGGGRYQHVQQERWFEADYIYYIPSGSSGHDKISRYGSYARKLLGIDLSPEVLWNLAPWSWAVDWFSNVGDVMHNISALGTDGLVMRNGYLMTHTCKTTVDHGQYSGQGYQYRTRTEESKLRRTATPYGFGVAFSSLSAKQVAVVSALGLSRW